ncbi:MAG: DUF721 domain-containing protein [Parcubacteria group bacterium]
MAKPIKLDGLIAKTINQAGITKQVEAARICDTFPKVLAQTDINKTALEKSQAIRYKYKILTVAVIGSSWAQELQMRRHLIIKGINEEMGRPVVHRIVFQIG